MSDSSKVNVLIAVLARQMGLVTDKQLTEAAACCSEPQASSRPFDEVLVQLNFVDRETAASLRNLAEKQLELHAGSAEQSIGTLYNQTPTTALPPSVRDSLDKIHGEDGDLWSTLVHLADPSQQPTKASKDQAATRADESGERGARFQKVREHAQGGLGQVFLAIDDELNRQVALKQIQDRFSDDKEARQRFMLEAEITGGLEHPGVVPVYGLGVYDDGDPYYAMRFIRGESMEEAIRSFHASSEGSPFQFFGAKDSARLFEFRKLLGRLVDVCQAIGYAHSRGVLHRDIKPDNIMLGKFGETLVVDWGLAKVSDESTPVASNSGPRPSKAKSDVPTVESSEAPDKAAPTEVAPDHLHPHYGRDSAPTETGRIVGTPGFMSPEQASGDVDDLDARSDVYSLGATLYSLLVGRPAFASRDRQGKPVSIKSVLAAVREGDFPAPRQVEPLIPKPLAAICERAMAHAPGDRYESPLDLADDIERWLSDEPTSAYDENLVERSKRWVKRHQSLATSFAAIVLVSTIGLTSFSLVLQRKNLALQIAEARAKDEAAVSRAVTEFMNDDLLSQASPKDRPDPHLEVRTVLDRAAESIEQQFGDQPLVKANLLKTIGVAYGYLGEYSKSAPALEQAVQLFEEHLGATSRDTLAAKSELGAALATNGNYAEAEKLLSFVLEEQISLLGENDKSVFDTQTELADLFTWTGKFQDAERLIQKAIAGNTRLLGPNHADTLACEATQVNIWNQALQFEEALKLGRDLLARAEKALGPEHLHTLEIMILHAQTLFFLEQDQSAKTAYERGLALSQRMHGEKHPSTLAIRSDLAVMESTHGSPAYAAEMLQEIYDLSLEIFGPLHRETIVSALHLSNVLSSLDRTEEAKARLVESIPYAEKALGNAHVETQHMRVALAWIHLELDELKEAKILLQRVIDADPSPDRLNDAVLESKMCRATILANSERFDDAIALLEEVRRGFKTLKIPHVTIAVRANHDLIWALVAAERLDEAESLVKEIATQESYHPADVILAKSTLANAYLDHELTSKAEAVVEELVKWADEQTHPGRLELASMYEITSLLYHLDRTNESIALLQRVFAKQMELQGIVHTGTLDTLADLAFALDEADRMDEAESLYRRLIDGQSESVGANSPAVQDSLDSLVSLLLRQDKHEAALKELARLRVAAEGDDEYVIIVDALMGNSYLQLEKFAEAAAAYASALELSDIPDGEEDEEAALWMHQLAWCYQNSAQKERAIPVYENTVRHRSRLLGDNHSHTLLSLRNLAKLVAEQGDPESTHEVLHDLAERIEDLDVSDIRLGDAAYTLGESYRILKEYDDAAKWYERSAASRAATNGSIDPATLLAMHQHAYSHQLARQFDDAVRIYKEVVAGRDEALGKTHAHSRLSLNNQAVIEFNRENYAEALPLYQDLLERAIEKDGAKSPQTMFARVSVATICLLQGELDQAILQYRESLEIAYKSLPKDHDDAAKAGVAVILIVLADAEERDGRFDEAWLHAREGREILEKTKPDEWHLDRAKSVMGGVHVSRKEFAEAISLLEPAFQGLSSAKTVPPKMRRQFLFDAARRLADAYKGADQKEKANTWRMKRDELRQ